MLGHMPVTGLGEFAGGLLHPLFTPEHILILLSLALLLAQARPVKFAAPFGTLAAAAAVCLPFARGLPPPALSALALCLGALVALGPPLPQAVRLFACLAAGVAIGLDSTPDLTGWPAAKLLAGVWVGAVLLALNAAFYLSLLPPAKWAAIAVRVAGSWIVAISVLMLAFALRHAD